METNQTPIMRPATRVGASLVIALKPTGLKHNSPSVCKKYVMVSHQGETSAPAAFALAGGTRMAKDSPANRRPRENFAGLEGSRCRRAIHSQAKTGAWRITNIGCTN